MKKLLTAALLLISAHSHAIFIHNYALNVDGTPGSFSYIAPGGSGQYLNVPMYSFDLTWRGVDYTAADVRFSSLWLNDDGSIRENWATTIFGSNCAGTICGVSANVSDILFQISNENSPVHRSLAFGEPGGTGVQVVNYSLVYLGTSEIVETVTQSVPEPGSLFLLGLGLAALMAKRKRV